MDRVTQQFIFRSGGVEEARLRLLVTYPGGPPRDDDGSWAVLSRDLVRLEADEADADADCRWNCDWD
jgi:hypothetical protein